MTEALRELAAAMASALFRVEAIWFLVLPVLATVLLTWVLTPKPRRNRAREMRTAYDGQQLDESNPFRFKLPANQPQRFIIPEWAARRCVVEGFDPPANTWVYPLEGDPVKFEDWAKANES